MKRFLFTLIILPVLLFSVTIHAQGIPTSGNPVILTSSADNPNPGQKVTVTASSYTIDINASILTWNINGKIVQSGAGMTTYVVPAPSLGKKLIVTVTAQTPPPDHATFTNSIDITSGSVDMVFENNGFIPPLFKGKTPIGFQNDVKIIAVPHIADANGVEYDPKTLVYSWKKNSRVVEDQSGYGKQTLTLIGDILPREANIQVTVSTRDQSGSAAGYITVTYDSPSLSFYIDDPLYGPLFNNAVKDTVEIGSEKETSVLAIPFGFNKPNSGIGDLALTWMIKDVEHPELATNQSITLRAPDSTEGSSNIELDIRNNKQIMQSFNAGFVVNFSSSASQNSSSVNF